MDPTKIAVAQLAITVAEPDANRQAAADAVAEAAAAGAQLVVLPELCDSGYVFAPEDPAAEARGLAAPAAGNPTLDQWRALARQHGLVIVGGFCELGDDGRLYNSAALVDASGTRAVYRKAHLWDAEKLVFTPGDGAPPVIDTEVGRVGVMVCYDLEFPEWTRLAALDGADLIAAPVNWPGYTWHEGDRPAEVVKAQATAAANGVFVAVADRCRTERGVSWISGSLIASPDGYMLAGPVLADRPALLTADCDLPRARNKRVSERNDLLADRRPELYAWAPDKRVAAARAHWAARFVANGTSYPDFEATMARIGRWDDWCREWGRTAQHYEQAAEAAEAAGRALTAGEAWRRAALCWHWGKFVFTDHPDEQRAAHERTVTCFRRGAGTLTPPAEPVRVPYGGTTLAAYLRVPRTAPGGRPPQTPQPGRPPVVIMIPGLDSVKEELQATAEYLLARGLAVIAVDGPGQGEAEYELPIEPAYERVTTAVADYLKGRDDIDPDRLGVFGVSLGGYYAARSAAYEPRVLAAVELAGPYRWDQDWDRLPPQTRSTFQRRSGAASPEQARERAAALTLEDAAPRITCPLLVVHGGRDGLIPAAHAERLAREAPGAELLLYPDGSHGVTNHAFESRAAIADWLAARLLPHASEEARLVAEAGLILRVQVGSGVHGIAIAGSDDRDEMGLCLEPPRFVTGLARVPNGIRGERPSVRFEQYERHTAGDRPGGVANRSGAGDLDVIIYSARKWARLALAGNPTVLLVLFVPDKEVVFRNEAGAELAANAHRFVSRLAAARYLGYLQGQKAAMTGQAGAHTNRPELVAVHGYDTKYAMHALRLGLQGIELLTTGRITLPVPEPDRGYLRSIRRGERPLAEVLDAVTETEARLEELRDSAAVPDEPDRGWVDDWLHRSYLYFWASLR